MKTTAWVRMLWLSGFVYVVMPALACDDDEVIGTGGDAGTVVDAVVDGDTSSSTDALGDVETSVVTDALGDSETSVVTDALGDSETSVVTDALGDADGHVDMDSAFADAVGDTDAKSLRARASLGPTSDGGTIVGTVDFVESDGKTVVTVSVAGATPGLHGMHIHQNGSCEATDAGPGLASGGHWNPADASHGYPDAEAHHAGDLGNVMVGADGTGTMTLTLGGLYLHAGAQSAIDRAVIFHAGADDGVTQPTGNSGGRPACGIITLIP